MEKTYVRKFNYYLLNGYLRVYKKKNKKKDCNILSFSIKNFLNLEFSE